VESMDGGEGQRSSATEKPNRAKKIADGTR